VIFKVIFEVLFLHKLPALTYLYTEVLRTHTRIKRVCVGPSCGFWSVSFLGTVSWHGVLGTVFLAGVAGGWVGDLRRVRFFFSRKSVAL